MVIQQRVKFIKPLVFFFTISLVLSSCSTGSSEDIPPKNRIIVTDSLYTLSVGNIQTVHNTFQGLSTEIQETADKLRLDSVYIHIKTAVLDSAVLIGMELRKYGVVKYKFMIENEYFHLPVSQ